MFLLALIVLLVPVKTVKAEEVIRIECSGKSSWVKSTSKSLNKVLKGFTDYSDKTLIIYCDTVRMVSKSKKKDILNELVLTVVNSELTNPDKNEVSNAISNAFMSTEILAQLLDENTSEDMKNSLTLWSRVSPYVSIVLGVFILGIIILIPLSMINDLAFMYIEVYAFFLMPNEDVKPRIVTRAAYKARREGDNDSTKISILGFYLRQQWKPLMVFMILIVLVIKARFFSTFGKLFDFVDIF